MRHFAGFHSSLDFRTAIPKPFLAFYPAIIQQSELEESINFLGHEQSKTIIGPPLHTEPLAPRVNYDTTSPFDLSTFGPTVMAPIGDIVLARSGDKGANVNVGLFVHTDEEWEWLRSFMTREQLRSMMGEDWKEWYFIERCEMVRIKAVHFVVYGPLGRGVSSSKILDALGKGFGEFVRDVHVPVPLRFLQRVEGG